MKDLDTIFRERRHAVDGFVNCPIDDWNAIVCQVCDLEEANEELCEMLDNLTSINSHDARDLLIEEWDNIKTLLAKVRGETK